MEIKEIGAYAQKINDNISRVLIGKKDEIDLILVSLFAGGHALLDDVPGTGKTVLAKSLAKSIQCDFKRIQFTADLLPSDITGLSVYNQKTGEFDFQPAPPSPTSCWPTRSTAPRPVPNLRFSNAWRKSRSP